MKPTEASLLQEIVADPDNDVPRLVYADWLEEFGDESQRARAEFIRAQIIYESSSQDDEPNQYQNWCLAERLREEHKAKWIEPLEKLSGLNLSRGEWRRGFLCNLSLGSGIGSALDELALLNPWETVQIDGPDEDWSTIFKSPGLAQIYRLRIGDKANFDDWIEPLLASTWYLRIQSLIISYYPHDGVDRGAPLIADPPPDLTELEMMYVGSEGDLNNTDLRNRLTRVVFGFRDAVGNWPQLEELVGGGLLREDIEISAPNLCRLELQGARELRDVFTPWPEKLEVLRGGSPSQSYVQRLIEAGALANLQTWEPSSFGIEHLPSLGQAHLPNLRHAYFRLSVNPRDDHIEQNFREFLLSPLARQLRSLRLTSSASGEILASLRRVWADAFSKGALPELRWLSADVGFSAREMKSMAEHWPGNLRVLDLRQGVQTPVSPAAIAELLKSPSLQNLTALAIDGWTRTKELDRFVNAVTETDPLPPLQLLYVSRWFSEAVEERLRKRLGNVLAFQSRNQRVLPPQCSDLPADHC